MHAKNTKSLTSNGNKPEDEVEVSDADVDRIVGVGDSSKLEVSHLTLLNLSCIHSSLNFQV